MWEVRYDEGDGWWCDKTDDPLLMWPSGPDQYAGNEGTAILMCDVLNARDYPGKATL